MDVYLDLVILMNFAVDVLLLLAANRLCGYPLQIGRVALAGALGGVYAAACLLPGFSFLGNLLWRTVSLGLMGTIAYGFSHSGLRRSLVFCILAMALGGLGVLMRRPGFWSLIGAAGMLTFLCIFGFRDKPGQTHYLPVELHYGDQKVKLTALQDTGNTLRDPVTGSGVLVVAGSVAQKLIGLTENQLRNPVESVSAVPGLRLIPYRAVGQPGGMLLALRLQQVKIGKWQGSGLVAFAPDGLSVDGSYQALTGGCL